MLIFTSTASILTGLHGAPASFASTGDFVIVSGGAPTIFSSRVEIGLASSLDSVDKVTDARPETIAFSTWNDVSFVLRGTDLDAEMSVLDRFEPEVVEFVEPPDERTSAMVGSRLLGRLGIEIPSVLPITGSYSSRVEFVTVVGWFESKSYLDDELLVTLEVAGYLADMPKGMASLVSVTTDDPEWLEEVMSPHTARFALFDVRPRTATIVTDDELTMSMSVRNWGSAGGEVSLSLTEGGAPLDERSLTVDAGSTVPVSFNVSFSETGFHSLAVSISGDFPMTALVNVTVVNPYLTVSAPQRAIVNTTFPATVETHDGAPVEGALVEYSLNGESRSAITDEQGIANLTADDSGDCLITATYDGYEGASTTVEVIDPSSYPDAFLPMVRSLTISSSTVTESDTIQATISVENLGASAGVFSIQLLVDSQPHGILDVPLGPVEMKFLAMPVEGLGVGTHTLQVGTFSVEAVVEPWYADEPDIVQLVIRYGGSGVLTDSASVPIYQAAKVSEGNVAVALFSIGAISAMLAFLAISAVFAKEVHESRSTLGILRTLGASRSKMRQLVISQALGYGLIGALAGVLLGLLVSMWITQSGAFFIFGHQLSFETDILLLVMVAVGAVVISGCSAFASAEMAGRETPIASMGEPEPEPLPEKTIEELLGED